MSDGNGISGKVALVTGAARGIGRATARLLARRGAQVAAFDVGAEHLRGVGGYPLPSRDDLSETVRLIREEGGQAIPLVGDVRDRHALESALMTCGESFGDPNILIANAGVSAWAPLVEMSADAWDAVIGVNLTGVFNCVQLAGRAMINGNGGRIVVVSSIEGRRGTSGCVGYSASKWGVIGLVKSAALELGPHGITVNAVAPTAVDTPLYRSQAQMESVGVDSPAGQDRLMKGFHALPVGAISPDAVADTIVFLCGSSASMISGAVIDVAAGGSARYTA